MSELTKTEVVDVLTLVGRAMAFDRESLTHPGDIALAMGTAIAAAADTLGCLRDADKLDWQS